MGSRRLQRAGAVAAVAALSSCAARRPAVKRLPRVGVLGLPRPGPIALPFVVRTLPYVVKDPLVALVTSAARAKMLTVLFGHPGQQYYQQQLAREARLPLQAVQRELRRLVDAQVIRTSEVGGRRLYEANGSSSIYPELFGLIHKLRGTGPTIERSIRGEDVRLAWIFGSFAKAAAGAESDIDLAIIGSARPRRIRERLDSAERALGRSINEHVLTSREWSSRLVQNDAFVEDLRAGPKIWLIGGEADLQVLNGATS